MRKYMADRRASDPKFRKQQRKYGEAWRRKRREATQRLVTKFKEAGCLLCQEKDPCCLDAHHIDETQKNFNISMGQDKTAQEMEEELKKCVCVCANCHRKLHANRLDQSSKDTLTQLPLVSRNKKLSDQSFALQLEQGYDLGPKSQNDMWEDDLSTSVLGNTLPDEPEEEGTSKKDDAEDGEKEKEEQ